MYLLVPFLMVRLVWRGMRVPAYWDRWKERFGFNDLPLLRQAIWIHAVSVGEVQAALPLIKYLLNQTTNGPLVVTTMTPSGSNRVKALFGEQVYHVYVPYDLPDAIDRFLNRIQPACVVIMETEIWPNIVSECFRRKVPVVLANARLSARSARSYRRIPKLIGPVIRKIRCIAVQTTADQQQFVSIGADPKQITVTGSIKMDIDLAPSLLEQGTVLRRQLGIGRSVWVVASTHKGEEAIVLQSLMAIRQQIENVLLVLVPRHPERVFEIERIIKRLGLFATRRTQDPHGPYQDVYIVDTMGELPLFFSASDLAFIGGSLVPVGGHNMIEAAVLGVPIIFGPYLFNFQEISKQLLQAGAARQVEDVGTLAQVVIECLQDANLRYEMGQRGKAYVEANRGALSRLTGVIKNCCVSG